jgi:multicomponent K+:H+ antiporter subunit G
MTHPVYEIAISVFLVIGGTFGLIGSVGLWKLRIAMQRLHAPTKASTVGVCSILVASSLHAFAMRGTLSLQEILILVFLFVTAPVTAMFLSKVHLHLTLGRRDIPGTGTDRDWATFEHDPPGPN